VPAVPSHGSEVPSRRETTPNGSGNAADQQSAGFTRLLEWDVGASQDRYPLLLHAHYLDLYRRQVVKQADLLLAQYRFDHHFDDEDNAARRLLRAAYRP